MANAQGCVKGEIRLNADQTKGVHPRIMFLSTKLHKELEVYVSTAKRRDAQWTFFATQKEPQCGFAANTLAQRSGLKLSAYAANHQIDVRRLYEAKRKQAQQAVSNWAVVRLKPGPPAQLTPKAREWVAPTSFAMQARLGNGVVLSWNHDQRSADGPCTVMATQIPPLVATSNSPTMSAA